jgi:ABC-2 type transport system ATP-binding protein
MVSGSSVVAPAIEAAGLTKRFSAAVLAVDRFDLRVEHGQVCGLLGPNGAGKTTTLRMLVGLLRPNAGHVSILGSRVRPGSPVLARVGTMIEQAAFVPYLSGIDNLRLYWTAGGAELAHADLDGSLAVADLGDAVRRKVKTFSQGMKQRLGVARALLGRPEVLILDEPTNGLDPGEMRDVRSLLRRVADAGTTVLLSTHLLSEVEQICDHVVVMDRGRRIAAGTVAELTAATSSVYVEVDAPERARELLAGAAGVRAVYPEGAGLGVELDGMPRTTLVATLVHGGVAVETVVSRHRLEDAFLGLLAEEQS